MSIAPPESLRQQVLIVGASLAALSTARALRKQGYTGDLVLVGDETHRPYDRPPLSKDFLHDAVEQDALGLEAEGEDLDATWRLGVRATALRPRVGGGADIVLSDGSVVGADAVVIATGAAARRSLPGTGLEHVHALRTLEDATALRKDLRSAAHTGLPVVVVGGGFIGSEVAATARQMGCHVTLVVPGDVPLRGALGPYADAVADLHAAHGVTIRPHARVQAVRTDAAVGLQVVLADGSRIPAFTIVLGVGATPAVEWLTGSGLDLGDDVGGAIRCDEAGTTNLPGVYAVGDCAAWFHPGLGYHHQVEHWTSARERGAVVAAHILQADRLPACRPPYVWSDLYGKRLQLAGYRDLADHPDSLDHTLDVGSLDEGEFVAVYRRYGEPVGVLGLGHPRQFAATRRTLVAPVPVASQGGLV